MRSILLGAGAGLLIGALGAWAISHFYYEGKLEELMAQLALAKADQTKVASQVDRVKKDLGDQVEQLTTRNEELKKLSSSPASTNAAPAAAAPPINIMALAGAFRGMGPSQQRLFLLKARLKLTPEQEEQVKAAMDDIDKARRDVFRKMQQAGGKIDPALVAAIPSLDESLAQVLTPDQMATYKKVQQEEKVSQAETSATWQLGQMTPLLQLTDTQKDAMYSALYQSQVNMPDATTLFANPNSAAVLAEQAKTTDAALSKILTPDQMTLYREQVKSFPRFGGGGRGGRGGQ